MGTKFSLKCTVTEIFEVQKTFENSVFRRYLTNGTSDKLRSLTSRCATKIRIFFGWTPSIHRYQYLRKSKKTDTPTLVFFVFFSKKVGVIGKRRAFPIIYISLGTIDFFRNQNLGILFYPPFPSVILLARKNPIFKNFQTNFAGHQKTSKTT